MGKSIISLLLLLTAWMAPGTSVADELALAENAPDRYVVVKGDTLWDISARFLRDPQHSLGGHRAFPDQTACGRQGRNGWRADPGCRAGKPGHTLRRRYRLRQRRGL